MARRPSPEIQRQWRDRLERHRSSGLTVARFCRHEGVSTAAFYNWKRRLRTAADGRQQDGQQQDADGRLRRNALFLPVEVVVGGAIEIELPSQALVRLPATIDASRLAEAIRAAAGLAGEEARC